MHSLTSLNRTAIDNKLNWSLLCHTAGLLKVRLIGLMQLCPTRRMRPSLGFRFSKSILHTGNLSLFR